MIFIFLEKNSTYFKLMASNVALNNTGIRFLSNSKSSLSLLEVLLHLQGSNVTCSHKKQISRPQITLVFSCQNYRMLASTVILSSLKTH